jgi:hypothetical protein
VAALHLGLRGEADMKFRDPFGVFLIALAIMLGLAFVACGQEPLPAPVGGPITDIFEKRIDALAERLNADRQAEAKEYQGLLDRLRKSDDATVEGMARITDWFKRRDDQDAERHKGILGILQELRDRSPGEGDSRIFPNVIGIRADVAELRATTGPIREAIGMLTKLVYAVIILAGVLLLVDVYRTFFRRV